MKSLLHTYTSILLLALTTVFSSCEQEMIEPMQATTTTTTNTSAENYRTSKFSSGNYIVQFQEDGTLQLTTNEDIELLAEEIASSELTFTDIYNFDGFKGFTGYLTKQQVINFTQDSRVLVVEPDTPIGPATGTTAAEAQISEQLVMN